MHLARVHRLIGIAGLIVFALTGVYMRAIAGVPSLDDVTRAVFRSRHIYLLLASLVNLAISTGSNPPGKAAQIASGLILLAPVLLLIAFFVDPKQGVDGHFAQYGLYALFGAAVLIGMRRP